MSKIVPHWEKDTPHFVSVVSGVRVGYSDYLENRNFSLSTSYQLSPHSLNLESLEASKKQFCVLKCGGHQLHPNSPPYYPSSTPLSVKGIKNGKN